MRCQTVPEPLFLKKKPEQAKRISPRPGRDRRGTVLFSDDATDGIVRVPTSTVPRVAAAAV
jgi:hypothetical protein